MAGDETAELRAFLPCVAGFDGWLAGPGAAWEQWRSPDAFPSPCLGSASEEKGCGGEITE
jgi:hypothetical protein